jgi:competence protein ComEA
MLRLVLLSSMLLLAACTQPAQPAQPPATNRNVHQPCVNLNTASAEELKALPEIGEVLASRIIEYRERHGHFRRPQDVIIIEGFTENKYRAIADRLCVE